MPQAKESHTMNRRALLATMAVTVPAAVAVAAAPTAAALADASADSAFAFPPGLDPKSVVDRFAELFRHVNIAAIDESDEHVVYAVRLPRETSGPDAPCLAGLAGLHDDATFGADLAAWIGARIASS